MKTIIILVSAVCVAAIGFAVWLAVRPVPAKPRTVALSSTWQQHVTDGYWQQGSSDAKVIIDEYSDFQCPYCKEFSAALQQAIPQASNTTVAVRFHHFPLLTIHNKAKQATEAAEAAGRQGKFWEMHNLLYQRQASWEQETTFSFSSILKNYAKEIGLDTEQFKQDLADRSISEIVTKNSATGNELKISGTPTVYINGTKVEKPPYDPQALLSLINIAANATR